MLLNDNTTLSNRKSSQKTGIGYAQKDTASPPVSDIDYVSGLNPLIFFAACTSFYIPRCIVFVKGANMNHEKEVHAIRMGHLLNKRLLGTLTDEEELETWQETN